MPAEPASKVWVPGVKTATWFPCWKEMSTARGSKVHGATSTKTRSASFFRIRAEVGMTGALCLGVPTSYLAFSRGGYWVDFLLPVGVTSLLGESPDPASPTTTP